MLWTVLSLTWIGLFHLGAASAYLRFTRPALGISRFQADSDPVAARMADRGIRVNCGIALATLVFGWVSITCLAWLVVTIATGAWMELVRGHEGADWPALIPRPQRANPDRDLAAEDRQGTGLPER